MANIFFLSQTSVSLLHTLQAKRLANFMESLSEPFWHVDTMAIYDPNWVCPADEGGRDLCGYHRLTGQRITQEILWPQIAQQLPKQVDVLFLSDPALFWVVEEIFKIPAYQNTKLAVDITQQDISAALVKRADIVFVSSQKLFDQVKSFTTKEVILVRDGVREGAVENYFLNKWKHRLPVFPWALYIVPEDDAHKYKQTVDSFGGSLGCIPIDSRVVFANCAQYVLTKQFRDCAFGELNLSRLQTVGILSEPDCQAVTQLAPVYALGDFSADDYFFITAQALYSGARVIAYKQALKGFESFIDGQKVVAVENASQFQDALRSALTKPPVTSMDQATHLHKPCDLLSARNSFESVSSLLQSVLAVA